MIEQYADNFLAMKGDSKSCLERIYLENKQAQEAFYTGLNKRGTKDVSIVCTRNLML